ncbi:MAG TPA: type II secretion system protein GspK [Xanthomonadales bacterium]|nr:type II secretion system protein GspK [Xanthomonadales bacterium]
MNRASQSGVALVLVLWITVLLTITSGAYALMARMDQLEANALLSGTQARMTAEAGIHLMAVALRDTDDLARPIADGRIYEQVIDGVLLEVSVTDERGKLDINAANEDTLVTLFGNNGLDSEQAALLAAAVLDWRDADEVERVNGAEWDTYMAAGLPVGPANRPFMMVDELLQVLGMSYELYRRIEPGISVYSRASNPDPAYAPAEALLAVPDMTPEDAQNFITERSALEPGDTQGVALPDGQTAVAQGRGLTYSIHAKATMPNGVWEQVEATIRLGGSHTGLPFRVLRWREGFHH